MHKHKQQSHGSNLPLTPIKGVCRSLYERKITDKTCTFYGYRVSSAQIKFKEGTDYAHIEPFYWKGKLVAYHLRAASNKWFKWVGNTAHLELFGQSLYSNTKHDRWSRSLVVTEGALDAMSVRQAFGGKRAVVSVPSGTKSALKYLKQNLDFLEAYDEIILWFDADKHGRSAVDECIPLFTSGKVKVAKALYGCKDANEMLQKGKQLDITKCVYEAQLYRPDCIVRGSEMCDILKKRERLTGIDIPYPLLNMGLKKLRKKEITTITAGTGIGKSHFVMELGLYLNQVAHQRIGFMCLEEAIEDTGDKLIALHLSKPFLEVAEQESMTEQSRIEYDNAMHTLYANDSFCFYNHFGSLDSERLFSILRHMALVEQVDFIILDHISIIVSGMENEQGNEVKAIDMLMTQLRTLVEKTGVGILLICHLRKSKGGRTHEEGAKPTLDDLRGSGCLKQLSDNVIGIQRNQQSEDAGTAYKAIVWLLKCRKNGKGTHGQKDVLIFNPDTERLVCEFDGVTCMQGDTTPLNFEEDFTMVRRTVTRIQDRAGQDLNIGDNVLFVATGQRTLEYAEVSAFGKAKVSINVFVPENNKGIDATFRDPKDLLKVSFVPQEDLDAYEAAEEEEVVQPKARGRIQEAPKSKAKPAPKAKAPAPKEEEELDIDGMIDELIAEGSLTEEEANDLSDEEIIALYNEGEEEEAEEEEEEEYYEPPKPVAKRNAKPTPAPKAKAKPAAKPAQPVLRSSRGNAAKPALRRSR